MKKNISRIVAIALTGVFTLSAAGCSEKAEPIEMTKTEEPAETDEADKDAPADEEGEALDIRGSWCDRFVEAGGSGFAAYVDDEKITVYLVTDKSSVYTPYWVGTYEITEGETEFSWISTAIGDHHKDCPYLSTLDEKEFTYKSGEIQFMDTIYYGNQTFFLERTELDFSGDYHKTEYEEAYTDQLKDIAVTIPEQFGFSHDLSYYYQTLKKYLSADALLIIGFKQFTDSGDPVSSDEFEKTVFPEARKYEQENTKSSMETVEFEEMKDLKIADLPGYIVHYKGVTDKGMEGDVYLAGFGDYYTDHYTVELYVPKSSEIDYEKVFYDILGSIAYEEVPMPSMEGTSIDKVAQTAESMKLFAYTAEKNNGDGTYLTSYTTLDATITVHVYYSPETKKVVHARILTSSYQSPYGKSEELIELTKVLCPADDAATVCDWIKENMDADNTEEKINGVTYHLHHYADGNHGILELDIGCEDFFIWSSQH